MLKLTVMSGLPGAGKTTRAKEIVANTGAVLVSRDALRDALVSLDCEWTLTLAMADLTRAVLRAGRAVVVDAWNLHPSDHAIWTGLAAELSVKLEWLHLATSVEDCVRRDAARACGIGERQVRDAALLYAARLRQLVA